MDPLVKELDDAVAAWDKRGWPRPDVVVVSGSGLSTDLGQSLEGPHPWADHLPFEVEGIEGHPLSLELLEPVPGRVVLSCRGRLHLYQGYTAAQAVFTLRLARLLGAQVLVMTNSSGGLHPHHTPGDMVVVHDHLNLTGQNPLYGRFPKSWGPQFPDMMGAYDPEIRRLLHACGDQLGLTLSDGVYVGLLGPSYETPAEVRMVRQLGGDVVGMSTVCEIIAAHHMGMRCACVSVVSNPGAGVTDEVLDHADVLSRGKEASGRVGRLLATLLAHPELLAG